jgi:hypothetical protein
MRDSQLEKMPLKELTTLQIRISQAIAEKRIEERHDVKAKMEELAQASGFSVASYLVGAAASAAKSLLSTAIPRTHHRHGPAVVVGRFG